MAITTENEGIGIVTAACERNGVLHVEPWLPQEDNDVQHEEFNKAIDAHKSQLQKHQVKPELRDVQVDAKAIQAGTLGLKHFSEAVLSGIREIAQAVTKSQVESNTKPQPKTLVKPPGSRVSMPRARVSTPLNSRTAIPLKRSAASDAVKSTSKKNRSPTEQSDFDSFFGNLQAWNSPTDKVTTKSGEQRENRELKMAWRRMTEEKDDRSKRGGENELESNSI
ncbi:uncharacterized protein B0J16DRAFT_366618 [Fusarium flagelliforme]|uniref:uncharacterized protein n=1 Tax=Fusarium flagelliforme TaxID=2675880 RepID=UPI001E8E9842|nr:uncharacterized protein B0J16DRAFT_366618 [Fusarium flagelliforme]KAH7197413.1 hypothetical protein B0J16DRAFT_366618 [Fusarium flagelliforme]